MALALPWNQEVVPRTGFIPLGGRGILIGQGENNEILLPKRAIAEMGSGRISLEDRALAQATDKGEVCAVLDWSGGFDADAAARCGVALERVLLVRCEKKIDRVLKAADWILHAGGFG